MRNLAPPKLNHSDLFKSCTGSIADLQRKTQIISASSTVLGEGELYLTKAVEMNLHQMKHFTGKAKDLVLNGPDITCEEFKNLYTVEMVQAHKPSRNYYDQIRNSAPNNKCPLCGFGHVTTIEHYLPKSKYPLLSIVPSNLIPSCGDCNSGVRIPTNSEELTFNPYFDDHRIFQDCWLMAKVHIDKPFFVTYFVSAPTAWPDVLKKRAEKHLSSFNLSKRYSIEATDILTILKEELKDSYENRGAQGVKEDLAEKHRTMLKIHLNDWRTALFLALSQSSEYCEGGFEAG